LQAVRIPEFPKKIFTVSEDLTILRLFCESKKEQGLYNIRGVSKKVADTMGRSRICADFS